MKTFTELIKEQSSDVKQLREIVRKITDDKIIPNRLILGALLTGSVARGDARIGPFGIMIDLAIVVNDKKDISLEEIFGVDEEPYIPFHCISIRDSIGLAIQVIEENKLWEMRDKGESAIFAMHESEILNDKKNLLTKWKNECFTISPDQIKERALQQYFRFEYLTGEYRFEKWSYRKAWVQMAQNCNEANECYCNFLYCINGRFIPRKDWLTYLTYEMNLKPRKHQEYMETLYEAQLNESFMNKKYNVYQEIRNWMERYCKEHNWLY